MLAMSAAKKTSSEIFAALACHHADDHPLAINVTHPETSEFAAPYAGAVEH
jgi:hypothetical protein